MKVLNQLTDYIQNLKEKDFKKYLTIFLIVTVFLAVGTTYYFYDKNNKLILQIKKLDGLIKQTIKLIKEHKTIKGKEKQLEKLLEKNKDFDIRSFFESFCKEKHITPEPAWDTTTIPLESDKFDEIELTATLKNLTTQKLVEIIQSLNKKEIIYIKEITITNEKNKTITIDITLAAKKYKKGI
ncbi:hypothetical protein KAT08_01215 [Candidatus Babeliales bacterium]|nr:hypothetical protein [Candidatus Babeliales bacterium]